MTRTEAARTNGALSHGPATEEGKARSSQNARKHGLSAGQVVLPGESADEFEELHRSCSDTYRPATPHEEDLVFEIATSRWRLRRAVFMEKAVIQTEMSRVANDKENPVTDPALASTMAWANVANSPAMKQIHRHEVRLRRACEKAAKELALLQQARMEAEEELAAQERASQQARPHPVAVPATQKIAAVQNEPVGAPDTPPHLRAA